MHRGLLEIEGEAHTSLEKEKKRKKESNKMWFDGAIVRWEPDDLMSFEELYYFGSLTLTK